MEKPRDNTIDAIEAVAFRTHQRKNAFLGMYTGETDIMQTVMK